MLSDPPSPLPLIKKNASQSDTRTSIANMPAAIRFTNFLLSVSQKHILILILLLMRAIWKSLVTRWFVQITHLIPNARVCAFHFVEIVHLVEIVHFVKIQFALSLYLQSELEFSD